MADSNNPEPMLAQEKSWNQRRLLEEILSRYFDVIEDLGDPIPTWLVRAKILDENTEDPHDALESCNRHLQHLGWSAFLARDEPWRISIRPIPQRLFSLQNMHVTSIWIYTITCLWLMGIVWVLPQGPGDDILDLSVVRAGLFSYALPMVAGLLLADRLQKEVARRLEVETTNLIPIALPLPMPLWPFGLFALSSAPRMDSISWQDRRRLGWVSLTTPVTILLTGMVLCLVGLALTPSERSIDGPGTELTFALLPQLIGSLVWDMDELMLRSAWAHPLAAAGQGLMLAGWLCLLPLPGLPGARVMDAVMEEDGSRGPGMQILMLGAFLGIGLMNGGFNAHPFWVFFILLGVTSILMRGGEEGNILIHDKVRRIGEIERGRMKMMMFACLLLMFPSITPTGTNDDWDSGIHWSFPDERMLTGFNESGSIEFKVENSGLSTVGWNISLTTSMDISSWNLSWECSEGEESETGVGCSGVLGARSSEAVLLNWQTPPADSSPTTVVLMIDTESDVEAISLVPDFPVQLLNSSWTLSGDQQSPVLCTTLLVEDDSLAFNLSLSSAENIGTQSVWSLSEGSFAAGMDEQLEICIEGEAGAMLIEPSDLRVDIIMDDGMEQSWQLVPETFQARVVLPSGGLHIDSSSQWENGADLMVSDSSDCPDGGVWRQPVMTDQGWQWNASEQNRIDLPDLNNSSLSLTGVEADHLLQCDELPMIWEFTDGPAARLAINDTMYVDWDMRGWAIETKTEGFNLQFEALEEGISFDVRNHGNGDAWNTPTTVIDGNSIGLNLTWDKDSDQHLMLWLEADGLDIEVHLCAWERS